MPAFVPLSRHVQSGKSSFIFKECLKTVVLAVVRAMHQWYLATSRQKTKAWICVEALVSTFCARGFIEGCSYKSLLKSWGSGLDPLIPRGKVRCRKACRAKPDRVRTTNCGVADLMEENWKFAKCKTSFVAWWSKFDWRVFGMWVAPKVLHGWTELGQLQ